MISQPNRRDRKKEALKKKIIDTALELFNEYGFEITTMEQIAQVVDIAKGTLYNYFPNKEAIISEYMKNQVLENEDELNRILKEKTGTGLRLLEVLLGLFKWKENNRDILKMHTRYKINDLISPKGVNYSNSEQLFTKILTMGQEEGDIRQDIPVHLLTKYLKGMYAVHFLEWLSSDEKFPYEEDLTHLVEVFMNGVKK